MISLEKSSHSLNNVTNLDEVRQAKMRALEAEVSPDVTVAAESNKADNPHGNRRFDAVKVARIKAAIAAGEYEVDPSRVADRFIEHDRNQ